MGPRAGLDRCGKSRPYRDSIPDRPARSQSLNRLRYATLISVIQTHPVNMYNKALLVLRDVQNTQMLCQHREEFLNVKCGGT